MAYKPSTEHMEKIISEEDGPQQGGGQFVPDPVRVDAVMQGDQPGNWASNLDRGALSGLLNFGRGISNVEAKGLHTLGIPYGKYMHQVSPQQIGQQAITPPGIKDAFSTKAGEFAGGVIPTLTMPLEGLIKGGLGTIAAKGSALSGALAPIYSPDSPFLKTVGEGMALGAVGAPVAKIASKAIPAAWNLSKKGWNALRSLGGTASPAQIERNIEAAGETKLPLAEIIQSPLLKKTQSALSYVPGSGMDQQYQAAGKSVNNRVGGMLKNLAPKYEQKAGEEAKKMSPGDAVNKALQDTYASVKKVSNEKYEALQKATDDLGFSVDHPEYIKAKNEILAEESESSPELRGKVYSSDLMDHLKKIGEEPKSYKIAKKDSSYLGDQGYKASVAGDNMESAAWNKLKSALDSDVKNSFEKSGHPELHSQWLDAKKYFSEEVAPLQEKEMAQFIKGRADTDKLIPTFLKSTQFERPNLLNNLISRVTDNDRKAVAHSYLTKGLRESSDGLEAPISNKVLGAYDKLGDNQKNILFSPEEKKSFDDIIKTKKLLGVDANAMYLPKTGARVPAAIVHGLMGAGAITGHIPAMLGMGAASNVAQRALMSKILQNLAKSGARASISAEEKAPSTAQKYTVPVLSNLTKKSNPSNNGGK